MSEQFQVWSVDEVPTCRECGAYLVRDVKYCPECGAPTDIEEYAARKIAAQKEEERRQQQAAEKRRRRVMDVCIALAGLAALAYLVGNQML